MRIEMRSYSKWRNAPRSSVADPLDLNMIGCWHSCVLFACIYIKLLTWPLRPSCINMLNWWPEGRGPCSLESITWQGVCPCIHLPKNSMPYTVSTLLLSTTGSAGRFGRSAKYSADRPVIYGRQVKRRPVIILLGQWCFYLVGGIPQHPESMSLDFGSPQRSRLMK